MLKFERRARYIYTLTSKELEKLIRKVHDREYNFAEDYGLDPGEFRVFYSDLISDSWDQRQVCDWVATGDERYVAGALILDLINKGQLAYGMYLIEVSNKSAFVESALLLETDTIEVAKLTRDLYGHEFIFPETEKQLVFRIKLGLPEERKPKQLTTWIKTGEVQPEFEVVLADLAKRHLRNGGSFLLVLQGAREDEIL